MSNTHVCDIFEYVIIDMIYHRNINISLCIKSLKPSSVLKAFNSLWPSDIIWQHRSGSTLGQVMAWWLMAPSHYLNQCWIFISEVLWHSPESNFTMYIMGLKIILLKQLPHLPGANELNMIYKETLARLKRFFWWPLTSDQHLMPRLQCAWHSLFLTLVHISLIFFTLLFCCTFCICLSPYFYTAPLCSCHS